MLRYFLPTGSARMSTGSPYFLVTARLGFRCWRTDDLSLALGLWSDPEVSRFIGGPFSSAQISQRLEDEISLMTSHRVQYWPVFLRDDGQHVGCAGLRPYQPEEHIYEIGVHLRPGFWRKGLAQEATNAIADYGFTTLGIRGLFAGHHPANEKSRHLLEKFGFTFIGEQFYAPTGLKHPSYIRMRQR
jgi:[ribosomal protein S5]-alanine N-acetyltransferase